MRKIFREGVPLFLTEEQVVARCFDLRRRVVNGPSKAHLQTELEAARFRERAKNLLTYAEGYLWAK